MKKYEVTIENATGSCDTDLFKKMAKNGDIRASKIEEYVDKVVKITGQAQAHIVVDDKEFDLTYFATDDGYFSTGSENFINSVNDYIDNTDTFKVLKVKTKKGHTYKANPIVNMEV